MARPKLGKEAYTATMRPDVLKRLRAFASAKSIPFSEVIEEAVERHIEREEKRDEKRK